MNECSHSWRYNSPDGKTKWCHHCGARLVDTGHKVQSHDLNESWTVWKIEPPLVFKVTL
jgi:hypothetical protein